MCGSLFEAGRNPFVMLVTIYVFMPYFSTVMVGDPVKGQALVAAYGQWAGWIIALTARCWAPRSTASGRASRCCWCRRW